MEELWIPGNDENLLLPAISSLSDRRDMATEDLHCRVFPIPGACPGYLQSWAHVGSDRQELHPVLGTLVGFLLSGKQTVILFKHHSPLELWWRKESSIHTWSIDSFTLCPIAAVTGGGCILACSSLPRILEAGDTLLVGSRKLAPNILTRGT